MNKNHYLIMGRYHNCPVEEIDNAETEEEAGYLESEYTFAFGSGWNIWTETKDGDLVEFG